MADEQRVSQGGVTVAGELATTPDRVTQGGVTVAGYVNVTLRYDQVTQGGVTVAGCPLLYPAIDITATVDGDDIDLAWTNVQENAYVRITHSTNGVDYSTLIELDGSEVTYTHEDPNRALPHYYILYAADGLCISSASAPVLVEFGSVHAYDVSFEVESDSNNIHSFGIAFEEESDSNTVHTANVAFE